VTGQFPAFLRRELLVFLPLLLNLLPLVGGQLLDGLVLLARLPPLIRRQVDPCAHLLLDALLLGRGQLRIPLGDPEPLLPPLCIHRVPLAAERGKDLFIGWSELGPSRSAGSECDRLGRRTAQGDREQARRDQGSECLSQAWNPRSR
jgi:hypothetical protein